MQAVAAICEAVALLADGGDASPPMYEVRIIDASRASAFRAALSVAMSRTTKWEHRLSYGHVPADRLPTLSSNIFVRSASADCLRKPVSCGEKMAAAAAASTRSRFFSSLTDVVKSP